MSDIFYRYNEIHYAPPLNEWESPIGEGKVAIYLVEYKVIKHTKCGVWIQGSHDLERYTLVERKRFVLLSARKKFACPTIEEAKESFIARKKRQIKILKSQLRKAESALYQANNLSGE